MKDWVSVEPDEYVYTCNYTSGVIGNKWGVCWHHTAGTMEPADCVRNVWGTTSTIREASAQYICKHSYTVQAVNDKDTSWHCGNSTGNLGLIAIEFTDETLSPYYSIAEDTIEEGAHLTAALCMAYGFGRPEWGVNLFGHSDWMSTDCPASLAVGASQHDYAVERAQYWYDVMNGDIEGDEDMAISDEDVQRIAEAAALATWRSGIGENAQYGVNDQAAWEKISWMHHDTAGLYEQVCGSDIQFVADATGEDVNSGVSLEQRLAFVEAYIKKIMAKLDVH